MDRCIAGIDEAGRGSVIGPMVLAGIKISSRSSRKLAELGVKDSKQLKPEKRIELAEVILKMAKSHCILEIQPMEIDCYCAQKRLNVLEAEKAWEIIKQIKPGKVYIDAPGKGGKKFARQISTLAEQSEVEIIAENFADVNYPVVAAASIVAKVARDRAIELLREKTGDFGSGYPSDPKTRDFLLGILSAGEIPSYVRSTWETVRKLRGTGQMELFENLV